ncbi:DNA-directed RNA polymerase [Companilactobacillus sp. RD055328]|nr:DNA-directed RNA polymerase [Companilactobacillus sp. RD055328]
MQRDHRTKDIELVKRVVSDNSSQAIKELMMLYTPMVKKLANLYYIRNFNQADWLQEAFIVCHETCFRFHSSQGSQFGSFFKLRLKNHYLSLVRHELAIKRKADREACSFDHVTYYDQYVKHAGTRQSSITIDSTIDLIGFCETLSYLEFKVFLMLLGEINVEEVCQKTHATKDQIFYAKNRCRQKLLEYIN